MNDLTAATGIPGSSYGAVRRGRIRRGSLSLTPLRLLRQIPLLSVLIRRAQPDSGAGRRFMAAADHLFSNCPSGAESAANLSIDRPTAQIPIKIAPTFWRRPDIGTKPTANAIVSRQVSVDLRFGSNRTARARAVTARDQGPR